MYLSVVSILVLCAASFVFRWAGRRRSVRLTLVGTFAASGAALALWFGLDRVTGAGINDAVFYHLATGLEGGDASQYEGLVIGSVAGLCALLFGCFWLYRVLGGVRTGRPYGVASVLAFLGLALAVNPFFVDVSQHFSQSYLAEERNEGFVDARLGHIREARKGVI